MGESFNYVNARGTTYHLNKKVVALRGNRQQIIYFFSRDFRAETSCGMPEGMVIVENKSSAMPVLKKS